MFEKPVDSDKPALHPSMYWVNGFPVLMLVIVLFWLGLFPQTMIDLIREYLGGG